MNTLDRRLAKLEGKSDRLDVCGTLLEMFRLVGPEQTIEILSDSCAIDACLQMVGYDNVHDLEKFRGLVPDEVIRDVYRSQINYAYKPEIRALIRERAEL